jgi:anti-sigma factor RsiW
VIARLRDISLPGRHPRPAVLSRYLEDELDAPRRHALEAHVRECERCRRLLASLTSTVDALGSSGGVTAPTGLADSIIEALRAESPAEIAVGKRSRGGADPPALTVVRDSVQPPVGNREVHRWPRGARAALSYCLDRRQLRFTLPIALVAGVVLSVINMGGMLVDGRIDLGVCVSCAMDFLVPFLALNGGLLMLLWVPRRGRL